MKRMVRMMAVGGLSAGLFALGGIGLLTRTGPASAPVHPATSAQLRAELSPPLVGAASLSQAIAQLQARLKVLPDDWRSYARLGLAYVQEARVTADPTYYPKAEGVLARSLALNGNDNVVALIGMASLHAARHDFTGALTWAERAVAAGPSNADAYAVLGDAQVELGRYPEAFDTFQRMVDLRPELSTYARVSYALELQGQQDQAMSAMRLALDAAGSPSDGAWAWNQLGELEFSRGHLGRAEDAYRTAVRVDPAFIPPHAGLAKVEAAKGLFAAAIGDYTWVVDRFPSPEYVIALGDVLSVSGATEQAARQFALVDAEERLFQANGVNVDLEIALFDADHRVHLAEGLAAARAEWGRRRSINVADALAWTLYASGRFEEALGYSDQALRLGTRNALFLFHRASIERALGDTAAARRDLSTALDINPSFSVLWSDRAAGMLRAMGGKP